MGALRIHISGENDAPVVSGDTTMVVNHFETGKAQIEIIMDRVEGTQGPAQTRTSSPFPNRLSIVTDPYSTAHNESISTVGVPIPLLSIAASKMLPTEMYSSMHLS